MPSQMKKEADMEITRQPETHIPYSRPITTAAESYQTKLDNRRPSNQMDSSLSVSPVVTTPLRNIINNAPEVGRVHALQDDRSLANSGESQILFIFIVIIFYYNHIVHDIMSTTSHAINILYMNYYLYKKDDL